MYIYLVVKALDLSIDRHEDHGELLNDSALGTALSGITLRSVTLGGLLITWESNGIVFSRVYRMESGTVNKYTIGGTPIYLLQACVLVYAFIRT